MDQTQMMTIDGMPVAINGEKNLLELIRKVGVKMPTFCYHSDLSVYGACRMCMVENERGGLEAACSTPPRPGMNIRTNTERLRKYRKMILELLLADHCRDCTTCSNNGHCKLQSLAIRFNISDVRFPNTSPKPRVDDSSVCITRDASKCILCGDCVRVCDEIQAVGAIDFINRGSKMYIGTAFNKPLPETGCVGCGQCSLACPTGAIVVKNHVEQVWKLLDDPAVRVSVQVAPAVRVAIGREFGLSDGEDCMGKVVTALRHMGFDEVYDTSTAADLTVMEEAAEFVQKFSEGKTAQMPLFTSCCPAWIQFCEKKHPDILPYLSTCRSPMQMFASVLRAHNETKKDGVCYKHVAVMPCTAKKFEAQREEFRKNGLPNVDYVITTQELIQMIKESGILFSDIEPDGLDMPFALKSGGGVIFGVSGGVTEAVLRRISEDKSAKAMREIAFQGVRGLKGVKHAEVTVDGKLVQIAVVSGLRNAENLIEKIKNKQVHYDFVEVMACPGGCICGGGQPFVPKKSKQRRSDGLYNTDKVSSMKSPDENPVMKELYAGLLKGRTHELLHVDYLKRQQ